MENWQQILSDLDQSGQSVIDFCKLHNLKWHTIRYWKQKRLRLQVGGFVAVQTQIQTSIEVIYPSGVRLRLSSVVSIKDLKALLHV